jgi:hypothetical protein
MMLEIVLMVMVMPMSMPVPMAVSEAHLRIVARRFYAGARTLQTRCNRAMPSSTRLPSASTPARSRTPVTMW